ncbi:hypothetical protein [uncultured Gammaproteobacteria bacterium]|jgi:hypothetical protein|nr:hypothetical protein [Bathymodiolus thermophilus thioautotrophic gill symbiont]CAC9489772.1 hypothetical protein [uncultured Gammaproteobacteria bacterium]CAB5503336.1 hypothetical protein AZO1586I_1107 [Bathymodiolus thermophilus thioautotrophic gill symbiont]CAC9515561.1 hypothetical protein [uncultured Gammaproteobacteria bacterium]CAC9525129.1 hypothetical protein [uncultured Gammaproteobacteria bacterium]CAC9980041.1 hypothetical protein [uncultured Gammaproteobacteria bacterium]
MPTKDTNEFKILLNLFEQAETKIKNVEQITSEGVLIPSINQLRYAGHHIVRSLLSDDAKEPQAERVKAINHVKRAIYDIDESLLIYYIESAVNFKEKYNDSGFVTEVVTDYPEKLATLDEANKSIQQLRENNNNYQDREQFYQKLSPYLIKLSKIVAIFEQSAPLIVKKQQDKDDQDLKNKNCFIGTIILSIILGIPSIIGIIVALK